MSNSNSALSEVNVSLRAAPKVLSTMIDAFTPDFGSVAVNVTAPAFLKVRTPVSASYSATAPFDDDHSSVL